MRRKTQWTVRPRRIKKTNEKAEYHYHRASCIIASASSLAKAARQLDIAHLLLVILAFRSTISNSSYDSGGGSLGLIFRPCLLPSYNTFGIELALERNKPRNVPCRRAQVKRNDAPRVKAEEVANPGPIYL